MALLKKISLFGYKNKSLIYTFCGMSKVELNYIRVVDEHAWEQSLCYEYKQGLGKVKKEEFNLELDYKVQKGL